MFLVFLLSLISTSFRIAHSVNYTGHSLLELPLNELKDAFINDSKSVDRQIFLNNQTFSLPEHVQVVWEKKVDSKNLVTINVPKETLKRIKRNVNYRLVTDNLQDWINEQKMNPHLNRMFFSKLVKNFRLDIYHSLDEVYTFLQLIAQQEKSVELFDIGTTAERRKIKAVRITNKPEDMNFIWVDALTHAREWITVSTALFFIERAIVEKLPVNFIIVPILNPDGYAYTWTNDRLWRKNRKLHRYARFLNGGDECVGVDLNRNYDINFGGDGSSDYPCSHLYQGAGAFSEPETAAVSKILWSLRHQVKLYLSLHSFNQLWSCPFAFTTDRSPHYDQHMDVLKSVRNTILQTTGVEYNIGPLGQSLYTGSGFSLDWAYAKLNIVHSYLAELRDKGDYGFLLPTNQIIPTAIETWQGLKTAIYKIFKL